MRKLSAIWAEFCADPNVDKETLPSHHVSGWHIFWVIVAAIAASGAVVWSAESKPPTAQMGR